MFLSSNSLVLISDMHTFRFQSNGRCRQVLSKTVAERTNVVKLGTLVESKPILFCADIYVLQRILY